MKLTTNHEYQSQLVCLEGYVHEPVQLHYVYDELH